MHRIRVISLCYLCLYLLAYSVCYTLDILDLTLSGDVTALNLGIDNVYTFTLLFLETLGAAITLFLFFNYLNKGDVFKINSSIKLDKIMLAISLLSAYSMIFLGVNTILKYEIANLSFYEQIIANINYFLQPIYLITLYLYFRAQENFHNNYYKLVFIIYFFIIFFSGFIWNILFLIPLVVYWIKNIRYVWLFIGVSIALLPILRILKWLYVTSFSNISLIIDDPLKQFTEIFYIILGHFNLLSNSYFISEITTFSQAFDLKETLIYKQGYFSFVFDLNSKQVNLPSILAYQINGKDTWSASVPLINYFLGSPYAAFINVTTIALSIFVVVWMLKRLYIKDIRLLFSIIIIFELIMSGWFSPYFQFIQAIAIFLFLVTYCSYEKNTN